MPVELLCHHFQNDQTLSTSMDLLGYVLPPHLPLQSSLWAHDDQWGATAQCAAVNPRLPHAHWQRCQVSEHRGRLPHCPEHHPTKPCAPCLHHVTGHVVAKVLARLCEECGWICVGTRQQELPTALKIRKVWNCLRQALAPQKKGSATSPLRPAHSQVECLTPQPPGAATHSVPDREYVLVVRHLCSRPSSRPGWSTGPRVVDDFHPVPLTQRAHVIEVRTHHCGHFFQRALDAE